MSSRSIRAIISGGQSGVDQAALMVAIEFGIPIDGWCPADRAAEDGVIPSAYPLRPTPRPEPSQRTSWNVFDSDATLILTDQAPSGGTEYTRVIAEQVGRPCIVLDPGSEASEEAFHRWFEGLPTEPVLNIAGPRESRSAGIGEAASSFLRKVLPRYQPLSAPHKVALVTGATGFLGSHILKYAPPTWRAIGVVRNPKGHEGRFQAVELSDRAAVEEMVERVDPDLIIHTAYSTVDPERDIFEATRNLAATGREMIHMSSDMVFAGDAAPYTEDADPNPISEYGRWKTKAEQVVRELSIHPAIIRISLITTFDPPDPRTEKVVNPLRDSAEITLYTDELRSPILLDDLTRQIWEIARLPSDERAGVWNLAGPESLSRLSLGTLIAATYGLDVAPVRPSLMPESPPRPRDLRLTTDRADRTLMTPSRALGVAAMEYIHKQNSESD